MLNELMDWRRRRELEDQTNRSRGLLDVQAMRDNASVGAVGAPGGILLDPTNPYSNPTGGLLAAASMAPGIGDVIGPMADARMFYTQPESRTWPNYGMAALGVLPAIPSLAYLMSRGGGAVSDMARRFPDQAGIVGYHGSPHRFPPEVKIKTPDGNQAWYRVGVDDIPDGEVIEEATLGRFRESQIGTGEGAQAYGHGPAYIAQNPKVAEEYQKITSWRDYEIDGELVDIGEMMDQGVSQRVGNMPGDLEDRAEAIGFVADKGYEGALREANNAIANAKTPDSVANWENIAKHIKTLEGKNIKKLGGNFYTVDVPDEAIDKMLDWDAPLSEQPWYRDVKELADEYKKAGKPADDYAKLIAKANARGNITGRQLYEGMQGSQVERSEFLARAGIPGIKYYDGGSRAAGEGTRNFVVFDENLPKILSRE